MSDAECLECLKAKWLDELRSGVITREEFNRRMTELRRKEHYGAQSVGTPF